MNKIDDKIIIITDKRIPQIGEKFINDCGQLDNCTRGLITVPRFIVGAEIEVQENADHLLIDCRDKNGNFLNHKRVNLPRKTVNKWLWERDYIYSDMKVVTKTHSENPPSYHDGFDWNKVPDSEIEVKI